jgi:hypothetical protein
VDEVIQALEYALHRLREYTRSNTSSVVSGQRREIAWGKHVSETFRDRVWWIADALSLNPDDLMACMAFESGETFRSDIKNAAGSGAVGLIQFMPTTAKELGTSVLSLEKMSPEDQLNYVYKYLRPWAGRLNNLGDIYMAILWPRGVGKPDSYVLWDQSSKPTTYRQNSGLDKNNDKVITRAEAVSKVLGKLQKGLQPENVG